MPINITYRTQLVGGVCEFCHSSRLQILNDTLNMVELIILLAGYREEGVNLFPKVYFTDKIDAISSMLPNGERIKIGIAQSNESGIKQAIKKCAPLAIGGWLVYICDRITSLEYGLFRGTSSPVSVPVDEIILDRNLDFIVVKVYRIASDCVEIRCNNGDYHYIFLNHRKEDSPPPLCHLDKLVEAIAKKSAEEEKEPTISFLKKQLFESLRQSHGCIIAVTSQKRAPSFLSDDGIFFDDPIDFPGLIRLLKTEKGIPSQMESRGDLLNGMLNSDGILIFNNSGKILGYNCFIKTKPQTGVIGGARKRAFGALCEKIDRGLTAVFMQSQDGWSDFKESEYV